MENEAHLTSVPPCLCSPECRDLALRNAASELAEALKSMRKEFGETNLAHGQKIAVDMAEAALKKAGLL